MFYVLLLLLLFAFVGLLCRPVVSSVCARPLALRGSLPVLYSVRNTQTFEALY